MNGNRKTKLGVPLVAAAICALSLVPVATLADKPENPGGGGNGGNPAKSEIFFRVDFLSVGESGSPGVRSDFEGAIPYFDGIDDVAAGSGKQGKAYVATTARNKKKLLDRTVEMTFPDGIEYPLDGLYEVVIRFRPSLFEFMGDMGDGDSCPTSAFRVFFEDDDGVSWNLAYVSDDPAFPDLDFAGDITRLGDTWLIEATDAILVRQGSVPLTERYPISMPISFVCTDKDTLP